MSAICGAYYKNRDVERAETEAVMQALDKHRFDKSGAFRESPVFLGCRLNCVTPESLHETLPFGDGALVITAAAIIDNREELFDLLSIPEEDRGVPDSLLILAAFKKWGVECPRKLAGDFSFAVWNKIRNELFCARDHTGRQTFYYYDSKDVFAFSTLMNPLFLISGPSKELNETYAADFLSITSVMHELGDDITIYKDILSLPPASAMLVDKNGTKKWRYWELKKTKEIRLGADAEYEEAFRKIYSEAVRCRLRSVKKVGVMLSGGLDSGSVACIAAAELKKRGERLYGFTQVPMAGYKDVLPAGKLADEREYVEANCRFAGNIEAHYLASEGRDPLTEIDGLIDALEQPYKFVENSHWINGLCTAATDMGIGVLLDGQSGNGSVSWGNFNAYMLHLLKAGHLKTLLKETRTYSDKQKISPGRLLLRTLYVGFAPYWIKKYRYGKQKGKDLAEPYSPVNPEFYRTMKVKRRFGKFGEDPLFLTAYDSYAYRMKLLGFPILSHLGAMETKLSLLFGLERRDPTRDVRLLEFCINLPENQWVRDGVERRLIRRAMAGYMPDEVRLNTSFRGRQAADWLQRIAPSWGKACEEMETIGDNPLERKYLDIPKIKRLIDENRVLRAEDIVVNDGPQILIRALIFTRFLRAAFGIESAEGAPDHVTLCGVLKPQERIPASRVQE